MALKSHPVYHSTAGDPPVPGLYTLPLRPPSTHASLQSQEDDDVVSLSAMLHMQAPPRQDTIWTLSSLQRTWSKSENNPENWRPRRRWSIIVLMAFISLVVGIFSSGFEPAQDALIRDHSNVSSAVQVFCNTIPYIGIAVGALVTSPLSELIGRSVVIHIAYILYLVFLAMAGFINNLPAFMAFRFFMGMSGVAFLVLGPAIVADIVEQQRRGLALSLVTSGFIGGKALGPILGEFVSSLHNPRWISWSGLIALGILYGLAISLLHETYPPLLRNRKEIGISSGEEQSTFYSFSHSLDMGSFRAAYSRPFRFLFLSPMIALLALYTAIQLSISQFIWIQYEVAIATEYGLPLQRAVLFFIGPILSIALSGIFLAFVPDHWLTWHSTKPTNPDTQLSSLPNLAPANPRLRLPFLLLGAVLTPAGIIWYGLTLHYHTHWILPILGAALLGVGSMGCAIPTLLYIVDAHTEMAASAVGAVIAVGALATGVVPLVSTALYASLGVGLGSAVLGAVAGILVPLAVILIVWGAKLEKMGMNALD